MNFEQTTGKAYPPNKKCKECDTDTDKDKCPKCGKATAKFQQTTNRSK
jgi:rRNA maturation protein Nop10